MFPATRTQMYQLHVTIINPCIIRLFISASWESVRQSSHESHMKFWSLFSNRSKVQISNGMSEILDWYRCNIAEGALLDSKNIICPVASDIAILESKALKPDKHAWEDTKYLIRQFLKGWNWCWRTDVYMHSYYTGPRDRGTGAI